jgi:nucleoside-diphosphate-sugar epimerase
MILNNSYSGKDILITGGLGFIGSSLAISLVNSGANVTILDSMLPEFGGNWFNILSIRDRVKVNISDMRDQHSLDVLVKDKSFIFHIAGQVSHGDSMRTPQVDLGVNCIATMNLVESCRRENPEVKLVFTSTRQVYGIPSFVPVTEEHPTLPVDVNGINKLAAEYYHLLYDRVYDLRSVVLRLTNTYGPRQQIRNNRQGFLGIFLRQSLTGERIKVFGDGRQIRDFNYVDDVVDAILLSASCSGCFGKVFNLGAKKTYSLIDVVEIISKITNVKYDLVPFPEDKKLIDIGDYYGDYSKFHSHTGWNPKIDLQEGIALSLEFYQKNRKEYWI